MTDMTPNEIWRRGRRVPPWRYRLEMAIVNAVWPLVRRIWSGR